MAGPMLFSAGIDATAVGGRLPDGAVGARVLDRAGRTQHADCGDGAWVALLPERFAAAGERDGVAITITGPDAGAPRELRSVPPESL